MFDRLPEQPVDKIMLTIQQFAADPRPEKMDLGVGVYRDATGHTPVMRAVKTAERRIWDSQDSKTYTQLAGDPAYIAAMADLVLGPHDAARRAGAATPGGTGALHQLLQMVRMARPEATVWIPDPTWPNHPAIIAHVGLRAASYRYFDPATGEVDRAGMLADIAAVPAGDVVLLHGCCHNPTGANPTTADWGEIAAALARSGAVPLIDLAYQGFGDSLDEDAAPTRLLATALPEVLIAASCSKNFGIYRDRAGVALALSADPAGQALAQGALTALNRMTYSFAPDHGTRIVATILADPGLRADWQAELSATCEGMKALRLQLAEALRQATNSDRFDFVARHRGMFSRLGITPDQVQRLRDEFGIYMIGDSRFNVAGLNPASVPVLARAVASVLR